MRNSYTLLIALTSLAGQPNESITFTKPDSADWILPENQDRITENVWITRKHTQSIFNIKVEDGYSQGSPTGTQWARSSTNQAEQENYTSFIPMTGHNPQSILNDTVSLYIVEDSLFYDVVFHSWTGADQGGGFSYTRTRIGTMSINPIQVVQDYVLYPNFPNPFNTATTIGYDLKESNHVILAIYDVRGRQVRQLVNTIQEPGHKSIIWNAKNDYGKSVNTGVYFYQIRAGKINQTIKMILVK